METISIVGLRQRMLRISVLKEVFLLLWRLQRSNEQSTHDCTKSWNCDQGGRETKIVGYLNLDGTRRKTRYDMRELSCVDRDNSLELHILRPGLAFVPLFHIYEQSRLLPASFPSIFNPFDVSSLTAPSAQPETLRPPSSLEALPPHRAPTRVTA